MLNPKDSCERSVSNAFIWPKRNIDGTNYGISSGRKNIKPLIKLIDRNYI